MRALTSTQRTLETTVIAALGVALAMGLVAGLVAGSQSFGDGTATSGVAAPATPVPAATAETTTNGQLVSDYVATLSNLAMAARRGDGRLAAAYRMRLAVIRTPETVTALHAYAARIMAGLATARAHHDSQATARYRQQFDALCADAPGEARLDFCEWTLP